MASRRRHARPLAESRSSSPFRLLAVIGLLAFGAFAVSRLTATTGPGAAGRDGFAGADARPPTRAPAPPPVPGHEVYGFVPYWEMDASLPEHVARTDLTTLALFSVTHRGDGSLSDRENGFRRIDGEVGRRLVAEAHERGVRVEIVYTSFGTDKNRAFYRDEAAQARWIEELVAYAAEGGFDGVNVDVEGLPLDLVPAWADFVGRLREALRAQDPAAEVSVATGANHTGAAMALAATAAGADRIFLMGYDYRVAGSGPGATSPMDRTDGDEKDLVWSLDLYATLGVPPERTILGLPLYGLTWPVLGPEFGAAAVGRGDAWVPRRNLGVFSDPAFRPTLDETESVEFYAAERGGAWSAVYFDSPRSLRPKLALADERGLAGAGFWAIGYERGLPEYTELIATFGAGQLEAVAR
jgi:spore germination protein YaaH